MAHVEYKSFLVAMLFFRNLKILQEGSLCTLLLTSLPRDIDIHGIRGAIQFSDFPSATKGRTAKSGLSLLPLSLSFIRRIRTSRIISRTGDSRNDPWRLNFSPRPGGQRDFFVGLGHAWRHSPPRDRAAVRHYLRLREPLYFLRHLLPPRRILPSIRPAIRPLVRSFIRRAR